MPISRSVSSEEGTERNFCFSFFQVFHGLLKAHAPEARAVVRQALEVLTPAMPGRMEDGNVRNIFHLVFVCCWVFFSLVTFTQIFLRLFFYLFSLIVSHAGISVASTIKEKEIVNPEDHDQHK